MPKHPRPELHGLFRRSLAGCERLAADRGLPVLTGSAVLVGVALVATSAIALAQDQRTPTAFGIVGNRATAAPLWVGQTPGEPFRSISSHEPVTPVPTAPASAGPTQLRIPTIGVSAQVERVAVRRGLLQVPDDISHVGWWTGSRAPGSAVGVTVIDGHVDSATDGEGALFHLNDLRAAQSVTLSVRSGRTFTYHVYARRIFTKSHALPAWLFTSRAPARLVLITCGGPFNPSTHSYLDNIAVLARPVTTH